MMATLVGKWWHSVPEFDQEKADREDDYLCSKKIYLKLGYHIPPGTCVDFSVRTGIPSDEQWLEMFRPKTFDEMVEYD